MDTESTSSCNKNTMILKEPRKKRRVRLKPRKPFPINIGGDDDDWIVYTGHLSNLGVCVTHPYEIDALHSMGYFGKGSLSRSYPNFEKTKGGIPPVARRRQWERRQDWSKQAKHLDDESFPDHSNEEWEIVGQLDTNEGIDQIEQISDRGETSRSATPEVEKTQTNQNESKYGKEVTKDPEAQESEKSINSPSEKKRTSAPMEMNESPSEKNGDKLNKDDEKIEKNQDDETVVISEDRTGHPSLPTSSKVTLSTKSVVDEVVLDSSEDEICEISESETVKPAAVNVDGDKEIILLNDDKISINLKNENFLENANEEINTEDEVEMLEREILVLPDSDSDVEDYLSKVKPTIEKEGFPIREMMYLTFEEAFFLMFGLGCLQIVDFDGNLLSILDAWDYFAHQRDDFVQKYVVYHYFRSIGWVVKSGLKYGGDFLLYKQGPPFYHASYIVIVEVLDGDTLIRDEKKTSRKMTWKKLFGLDRLSETAAKEILFAQVLWPSKIPRDKIPSSPELLADFTVHELLYRRWIPKQNREEIDLEDENEELH